MLYNAPLSRRGFIKGAGMTLVATQQRSQDSLQLPPDALTKAPLGKLPHWRPGYLDIHHISTGRGSCAFFILPDATTMIIDCGDVEREPALEKYSTAPKPTGSLRPGQWVARYIDRHLPDSSNKSLDYFVLTHFHTDHMGAGTSNKPLSKKGNYRLSGVTDVAEILAIRKIIDRNYPTYDYPRSIDDIHQLNYRAFVRSATREGSLGERLRPGKTDQIVLVNQRHAYPEFQIRNLAANGEVWTRLGESTQEMFPPLTSLAESQYPDENICSLALRLDYGSFSYYTGGDLTSDTNYGVDLWRDIETPVAEAAGPVTAAVANHHGFVNACGPNWVRALRPRIFVVEAWTSAHPVMTTLDNMFSKALYPEARSVYSTALRQESRIAVRRLDEMASQNGHLIIRVDPHGRSFQVFNTSNSDESDSILSNTGVIQLTDAK